MIAVAHMPTKLMPNAALLVGGQAGTLGAQDFGAALRARLGLVEGALGGGIKGAGKVAVQVDHGDVKVGKDSSSDKAAKGHKSAAKNSTKADAAEVAETETVANGAALLASKVQPVGTASGEVAAVVEGSEAVVVAGAQGAAGPSAKPALSKQILAAKGPESAQGAAGSAGAAVAETATETRAVAPVLSAGLLLAGSDHAVGKLAAAAALIVGPVSTVVGAVTVQPVVGHGDATKAEVQGLVSHAQEAAARPEQARVYEASTGVLEVGVATGTHGWLRVRAEMDGGGAVTAQVVAANAGAAESLHKELPAISAYLAHEQVGVSSLVVNAMAAGAGASDAALGAGAGAGTGSGQAGSGGDGARQFRAETGFGEETFYEGLPLGFGAMGLPAALYGAGMNGGWLSVRV